MDEETYRTPSDMRSRLFESGRVILVRAARAVAWITWFAVGDLKGLRMPSTVSIFSALLVVTGLLIWFYGRLPPKEFTADALANLQVSYSDL